MFRGISKSEINPKNFGVGSIMKAGRDEYLVVAQGDCVGLVALDTFEVEGKFVKVQDPNFLSMEEVRELAHQTNCTVSDFDFLPAGLKGSPPHPVPNLITTHRGIGINKM